MYQLLSSIALASLSLASAATSSWYPLATRTSLNTVSSNLLNPVNFVDNDKNSYLAYFEQYDLPWTSGTQVVSNDRITVEKLDPSGNSLWVNSQKYLNNVGDFWGQPYLAYGHGHPQITVDSNGETIVAFVTAKADSSFHYFLSLVVYKIDASGNQAWIYEQNANTTSSDFNARADWSNPSITVDSKNNIYIASEVYDGVKKTGNMNVVVVKLSAGGKLMWSVMNTQFNVQTGDNQTPSIAVDASGSSIFVSYVNSVSATRSAVVVFKLDGEGKFLWLKSDSSINTPDDNNDPVVATDALGNSVFVSYWTVPVAAGGASDIVVVRLNGNDGSVVYLSKDSYFNSADSDAYPSIAMGPNGASVYLSFIRFNSVDDLAIVTLKFTPDMSFMALSVLPTPDPSGLCEPSISVDFVGNAYTAACVGADVTLFKIPSATFADGIVVPPIAQQVKVNAGDSIVISTMVVATILATVLAVRSS